MADNIREAFIFLINTVFDLYLFILLIRIILGYVGANYFDPIVQFITKCTDYIIKPLRRVIPNVRRFETATLVVVLCLQIVKYFSLICLRGFMPEIMGVFILACADTIKLTLDIFLYGILLFVILSWAQPMSPANRVIYQIISPLMTPLRRVIPTIGGLDISPIAALLILQVLNIIAVAPLMQLGQRAAFG